MTDQKEQPPQEITSSGGLRLPLPGADDEEDTGGQ